MGRAAALVRGKINTEAGLCFIYNQVYLSYTPVSNNSVQSYAITREESQNQLHSAATIVC